MNTDLKNNMDRHNNGLSVYACTDDMAYRLKSEDEDIRSPFFHDIDRIIYANAYLRYMDKTQVFARNNNDHVTKRMIHVQYVSKIARTIGRALGLNEDLIEAASLGHDLGHVPYGHVGESILSKLSRENGEGYFNHNIESVRLLMNLENDGLGLNLNVQTLDAIMCHNGELLESEYKPNIKKTKEEFLADYNSTYKSKEANIKLLPMTLEGCVVRISDVIAYLGRDVEDAIRLGIINANDIPLNVRESLGLENREIVNTIINDIINNSLGKNYIKLSHNVYEGIKSLMDFNYKNIYAKAMNEEEKNHVTHMFTFIFNKCLEDLNSKDTNNTVIFREFLFNMDSNYLMNTSKARMVIDFIAGMTDDYFNNIYRELGGK